jgi:hypothetical protein
MKISFFFEDEEEHLTAHIYQLSLIIPNIIQYYNFLCSWDVLIDDTTGQRIRSYKMALS